MDQPKPTPEQHLRKHLIWAHGKVAVFSPPDAATGGNIVLMAADALAAKDDEIKRLREEIEALRLIYPEGTADKLAILELDNKRLRSVNTAALHHIDREWQYEQYDRECTCGAVKNLRASQVRDDADGATMFVPCDNCDGSGIIARRVTVYEHGCGFPHDDTEESPCPECDGTGQREVEAEP
jgi:hypothetical protein